MFVRGTYLFVRIPQRTRTSMNEHEQHMFGGSFSVEQDANGARRGNISEIRKIVLISRSVEGVVMRRETEDKILAGVEEGVVGMGGRR